MSDGSKNRIRDIKKCRWCWIDKSVIQEYGHEIGILGVAVYSFLACKVDKQQKCFPSQRHIADKLGCSRASVNRAVKKLEKHGLIKKDKINKRHCAYFLLDVMCYKYEHHMCHKRTPDVKEIDTNDKRLKNNITIDKEKFRRSDLKAFKDFIPRAKAESLALELANELNDHKGLPLYISFAKKYPESLLRKVLGQVKEIPQDKIKKNRGALFNHLVRESGENPLCS